MLRYLSKRNEDYVILNFTQNLKVPLITIAKARSNTNAQDDLDGLNWLWYIHTMEFHSAIKWLSYDHTTWMNLRHTMLSKRSYIQKSMYFIFLFIWISRNGKINLQWQKTCHWLPIPGMEWRVTLRRENYFG